MSTAVGELVEPIDDIESATIAAWLVVWEGERTAEDWQFYEEVEKKTYRRQTLAVLEAVGYEVLIQENTRLREELQNVRAAHEALRSGLEESVEVTGDVCVPWEHSEGPLDPTRFAAMCEALEDPRATSKGHKRTIAACRSLADEVIRLLEALRLRDPGAQEEGVGLGDREEAVKETIRAAISYDGGMSYDSLSISVRRMAIAEKRIAYSDREIDDALRALRAVKTDRSERCLPAQWSLPKS